MENPWIVESLEEFLYFCCPECNDKSSSKETFINHAWTNHPKAQEILVTLNEIKPEFLDENLEGERLEVKLEVKDEHQGSMLDEADPNDHDFNLDDNFNEDFDQDEEEEDDEDQEDQEDEDQELLDEDSENQCYYCGQCISIKEIKTHMLESHGAYHGRMHGKPRSIQCDSCKATFKTESALKLHLCYDEIIPKKKYREPYKCDKCDKTFRNRKSFR